MTSASPSPSTSTSTTELTANDIQTALASLQLKDTSGAVLRLISYEKLREDRRTIYAGRIPGLGCGVVLSVRYEDSEKAVIEHILHFPEKAKVPTPILLECKILMDDLPPCKFAEYCFTTSSGGGGPWLLAPVCIDAVEMYRKEKFKSWREMFDHATCEAALRRLLKDGLITTLYDEQAFPEPTEDRSEWEVIDERTGKTVHIPHPVQAMRYWNPERQAYDDLCCRLEGAPAEAEASKYWAELLEELYRLYGREYTEGLIAAGQQLQQKATEK